MKFLWIGFLFLMVLALGVFAGPAVVEAHHDASDQPALLSYTVGDTPCIFDASHRIFKEAPEVLFAFDETDATEEDVTESANIAAESEASPPGEAEGVAVPVDTTTIPDIDLKTYAGISALVLFLIGLLKASLAAFMKGKERIGVIVLTLAIGAGSKLLNIGFIEVDWVAHSICLLLTAIGAGALHDKITNPVLEMLGRKPAGDEK